MFYCYSGTAGAKETETLNSSSVDQIQQPPLTDTLSEINPGAETIDNTSEDDSQPTERPVEQPVEPTPQPPLIDAQPVELPIEPTPQPPLIDAQTEPSYEPDKTDGATEEKNITSTTQTPEPSTDQPISTETTDIEEPDTVQKEQEETKTTEQTTKWSDTRPQRVSADWLQLTSGEWLRGRIIAMQKDDLEFDSDELKKLVIEWKKVKYIKSSDPYRLRFDDNVQAIGAIEITQQEVHVTTDYDDQVFDRSKLLTIASGKETEISYWTSKVTFSINVRRGNTDQTDFTSRINARRQTIDSRLNLDYLGNFTAIEETTTINNHRLNATYDIFITRDMFVTLVTAEYYRDPFVNIEQRIYVGAAIGYSLINTNETEWDISAGPAYQSTKFDSVQPDQSPEDYALTLILSTKFD
ncbi:MAG: DUF481 domain-containing protein, partial [Gammaproteobacteria bacterium]|nr:DUF481 domain-containing protein [Gammaproteobacteria bacterium]